MKGFKGLRNIFRFSLAAKRPPLFNTSFPKTESLNQARQCSLQGPSFAENLGGLPIRLRLVPMQCLGAIGSSRELCCSGIGRIL